MKFVKHLAMMAMVAVAAIATTACGEPEEQKNPNLNHELALSVDVENITATSAKVKVTHNGKAADSWYGLLTTDTATRIDELIEAEVNELRVQADDLSSQLVFSKSYVKILSPLTPNTEYRYIAFGLSEEGEIYGDYSYIEFTTLAQGSGGNTGGDTTEDEVYGTMIVNPSWSIAFTGAGTIDGESYNNTVTVTSTDNNPYTIAVVYASEYDVSLLPELGAYLVEDMYAYLESVNSAYGSEYVLNDILYRGNGMTAFDELDPGYYIAVALGVTSKGEISGLYAVSSAFEIEEEVPTSIYNGWIGDWVIKGDNNISNDVVIGRKYANRSFNLMGLMGLPFSIVGEYSTERNDIIFYAQIVEPNYTFDDGTVANICLIGVDKDGNTYGLAENGEYGIAIAGVLEGGQRAIVRYGVNQPDYPKFCAMLLVAEVNGSYHQIGTSMEKMPAFNVMATIDAPATEEEAVAVAPLRKSSAPLRYALGKKSIAREPHRLMLGKELEMATF